MRVTKWLPVVLLAILLAALGAGLLWTTLMVYDDEGYVLYSLRTFVEIGGLYEKVFSQYGPFFYLWNWCLHQGGLDFTHTAARGLTLIYWLISALACARITARLTSSAVATSVVMTGVFLHLWPLISEPSHPGGLICAVVALVAWLGISERIPPAVRAAGIGAAVAVLVLTKINVGIFLLAGTGAWWLLAGKNFGEIRGSRWAVAGVLALVPILVMHSLLGADWVFTFALVVSTSCMATIIALPAGSVTGISPRWLWHGAAVGAVVAITTGLFTLASGTTLAGLLEGVLLGPLRHPLAYTGAVKWLPGTTFVAVFSLALLGWVTRLPPARRLPWVAIMRLVPALFYLLSWGQWLPLNMHAVVLSFGLSTAAWYVLPLREKDESAWPRGWLALLTITQSLHAYPVAGSQTSWGTFLWLPLVAVGVQDTLRALVQQRIPLAASPLRYAVPTLILAYILFVFGLYAHATIRRFPESDQLQLPGAETLYLPESTTSTLRVLSYNAAAHAEPLFSLPGMLSFHTWSDSPPPTTLNATHWFTLLKPSQQEAIRTQLESSPRSSIILHRGLYNFLKETGVATESSLTRWIHENYTPAFSFSDFEFLIRRNRTIAAFGTVELLKAGAGVSPRYKLAIIPTNSPLNAVSGVTLGQFYGDLSRIRTIWSMDNATIRVVPLSSAGLAMGLPVTQEWPFSTSGLVRVELYTDELPPDFNPTVGIVHFRDATGRIVAEARFVD